MKAMLLAAGEGSRLRPLTDEVPKPMVPIAGRPILEHNVRLLARHGVRDITINLHHKGDVIRRHFGDGAAWGVSIRYVEEPSLLGTAGGVKNALRDVDGTFLVAYGDNLSTIDLTRMLRAHRERGAAATMALFHREHVLASGIVGLDEQDRVTRFLEKPKPDQVFSHWVNAGYLALEPSVLARIPAGVSDFGRDVLPGLDGLYGYRMGPDEGLWWIDTHDDYHRLIKSIEQGGVRLP